MKELKKVMTVALSLVLCASLVAPGFAGTFAELREIIGETEDGGTIKLEDDYSSTEEDPVSWIQIYNKSITLDLNGHTLTGDKRNSVIKVIDGSLTLDDSSEDKSGLITGGARESGNGGGVLVLDGDFTMNGGTISGNSATYGGGVYAQNGTFTMNGGTISGNSATYGGGIAAADEPLRPVEHTTVIINGGTISDNDATYGGGIYNRLGSETTVNDGEITGNTATEQGGGVYVFQGGLTLNNGTISNNEATYGGGVFATTGGSATVNGGEITGNSATNGGGVYVISGGLTVNGGEVSGNHVTSNGGGIYNGGNSNTTVSGGSISGNTSDSYAGGVFNSSTGKFTLKSGKIYGNEAGKGADDIRNVAGGMMILPDAGSMGADLNGKDITGWYHDYSSNGDSGWGGNGEFAYYEYDSRYGLQNGYTGQLLLKAAHDAYFVVTDEDGSVLAEVKTGTELDVSKLDPGEREGYTFLGWTVDGEFVEGTLTVDKAITLVAKWEQIQPERPTTPNVPDDSGASDIEMADPEVPLASGPVTRAEFIDYLWRHEDRPEGAPCTFTDVPEDHQFALALGWAQEQGIAVADENGAFQPDDLVTVGAVRMFLDNFAQAFDMDVDVYALVSLTGGMDEAVLNCDEVIAEFFGEDLSAQAA